MISIFILILTFFKSSSFLLCCYIIIVLLMVGIIKGVKINNLCFNTNKEVNNMRLRMLDIVFCVLIAFIGSLQFALCPLSKRIIDTDSSVFIYIGQQMHNGLVPYKDIFDHKGIILYFIEWLGLCLPLDNFVGMWIIEVINLFLVCIFSLKIIKLLDDNKIIQYISFMIVILFIGVKLFEGGNLVEEYALLWITLSLYIFIKFLIYKQFKNYEIILLGISFTIVFFLRANMIAVWIVFIPLIICYFIKNKMFNTLFSWIIKFLIGIIIVCIPIFIYLILNNCVQDMFNDYILFNFSYTEDKGSLLNILKTMFKLMGLVIIVIFSEVVSFLLFRKNKIFLVNTLFFIITFLLISISGRKSPHYCIILIPAAIIPVTLTIKTFYYYVNFDKKTIKSKKLGNILSVLFTAFLTFIFIYDNYQITFRNITDCKERNLTPIVNYVKENTDKDDDVLVIGNECSIYLQSDRSTKNKFVYQTPPINISDELYNQFTEELKDNFSDCVIINKAYSTSGGNFEKIYEYFEDLKNDGIYTYQEYDDYYIYTLV